ncbi:MAG: tetratricopeptide repeat protein, partial [Acidobacteriota bacterium]|nr:tetratricopeptide repeat protein [Acidobacteriota bacterium]
MRRTLSTSLVAALVAVCVAALAGAQSASYYFAIAKMYAAEGSYREAVEAFTRAVALEPEDPYIRMEYAELLSRTGRSRQAAEVAGQALELAPLNPDALRLVGEIRLELAPRDARSLRLARDAFEKLRDIDPADTPSLLTLARIYLSQNNAAGALETLEVASSYNPNHPAVHRALLEAVASSGDDDKALELLPGILQRDPGFLAGRLALARVHSERGDHGAAVSVLDAAPPDDGANPDAMYLLASELFRRAARGSQARAGATDDLERAAGLVKGILDEQPTHLEAQYLRGLIVAEQGDLEAAIGGLETLYEVAPQDLRLRIGSKLSQLLEGEGRVAEAAALLSDLAQEQKQTGTRDVMADRVLLQVARLHQRHQEWQELEAAAEKLMEASETALRLEGALLMAEALHEGGDSRAALQHLRRRSADFDDPTRLQLRRAEILDEMGNRGEADRTLARLVESGEVPALLAVAQFHLERGNEAEVVPVLEVLLAQPKDSVDAGMHREIVYLLSDSLITLERGEDALAVLSSAAGANSVEGANLDQRRLQLKRAEILETLDRGEEAAAIVAGITESPDRSAALLLVNYYQRQ